jgi:hypothetical protein
MAGTNVPTFTFGPTGFQAPTGPAVLAGEQADINAAFNNTLNYQLTTPQGQLASSQAAIISNTYATFQYYTQQVDPAYSSGRMQDAIGRIYFLERDPAQPTSLQVSCLGGAGVVIPAGALIVDGSNNLYQCTLGGTIPKLGSVTLEFACTIPGPTAVPAANGVSIYQSINGWDAVSVVSGVVGRNVESRAAFEARRADSVAGNSFGPIGAIIGAVSKVPNVLDYFGYNNNTAAPVTVFGVTIPANAIYISVAGGTTADIATAILSKKGAGAPMAGNTTVTVFDNNPLYAAPIPYQITFMIPTPLQLLWDVVLVSSPLVPSDATTQVQNALIAAASGQSNLVPPPPRARIGTTVYAASYTAAINALGSWAQVASITVGSINRPGAVVYGYLVGTQLTVTSVTSGTLALNQALVDAGGVILNGTFIIAFGTGGGGTGTYVVNQPQTVGATFTGSGSGTNLTTSAVAGTIAVGDLIVGTGVPGATTIVSQTSGTPGGAGVYVTNNATTSSGAALTASVAITTALAGSPSQVVNANQVPQVTAPNILVSTT